MRDAAGAPKRHVLIVGAMKSGTTTLFDLLAAHPGVAPCRRKEPGFFAFEELWAQGLSWYDALFDVDPEDRGIWRLDGSTDYLKHPFCKEVPERLAACPDRVFRLICILRHPLRRIESHARHVQRTRREVGRFPSPRADHGLDAGVSPVSLAISEYARQLDVHRAAREAGDLLVLTLEELEAEPEAVLARVHAFLGLSPSATGAPERSNVAAERREISPLWGRLTARRGPTRALRALLPEGLRRRVKGLFVRRVEVEGRFRLTPAEEADLLERLRPDLARLRDVHGVDVEGLWGIDPGPPAALTSAHQHEWH